MEEQLVMFIFGMDGDMYYCHLTTFENPMESPIGYGSTKKEALKDLAEKLEDHIEYT